LKKNIFISIFLISTLCTAQINDSFPESKNEYLELLNYTPKYFNIDLKNKPSNKFLKTELNSIWKLKTAYELKGNLNNSEIIWLEEQINKLALTFFLENKPIIIQDASGYSGCPEQLVTTVLKNETEITIVSFCFGGCIRDINTENFIRIFNNRTEKLLETEKNLK